LASGKLRFASSAMTGDWRSPSRQAVLLAGATGLSQLAVAVVYILVARWADPAGYGLVVAAVAVGTTAAGVFDFGANSLWVRELASGRLDRREAGARAATKLLLASVIAAVAGTLLAALVPNSTLWVAAPIALGLTGGLVFQVPLRAAAQSHLTAIGVVVGRFTGLGLLLALVAAGVSPVDCLWLALLVGSIVEAITHLVVTPASYRYIMRGFIPRNPWKDSRHYGVHGVAMSLQNLDVSILNALGGAVAAGLYGAVNRWTQPLGIVINAYTSASMPFVARARRWREVSTHLRSGLWMPALAVVACVAVAGGAPWIVPLLLGTQYSGSTAVLVALALGTIPAIANQPLAVFLQALGSDATVARVTLSAVVGRLALVALVATQWGAMGAALAFGTSQAVMCVVLSVVFVREVRQWRQLG